MTQLTSYMSYQDIAHIVQNCVSGGLELSSAQFDYIVESRSNDPVLEAAIRLYPIPGMRSLMNKELDRRSQRFSYQSHAKKGYIKRHDKMRQLILSRNDLMLGERTLNDFLRNNKPTLLSHVKNVLLDWLLQIKKTDWIERMLFNSNPNKEKKSDFIKNFSDYIDFIFYKFDDEDAEPEFLLGAVLFIQKQSKIAQYELIKSLFTILNDYRQICKKPSHQHYEGLPFAPMKALSARLCEMWQDDYLFDSKEENQTWNHHYVSLATQSFIYAQSNADLLYHLFYEALEQLQAYRQVVVQNYTIKNTIYDIERLFQNYVCNSDWELRQPMRYIRHFVWKAQGHMLKNDGHCFVYDYDQPLAQRLRDFLSYTSSSIQTWIKILDDYPDLRAAWHKHSLEEHKKILIDLVFEPMEIVPDKIQVYLPLLKVSCAQISQKICTLSPQDSKSLLTIKSKMCELGGLSSQHLDFLLQITNDRDLSSLRYRFEQGSQPAFSFLEAKQKIDGLLYQMKVIQQDMMRSQPFMTHWITDPETVDFLSEQISEKAPSWLIHNSPVDDMLPCRIELLADLIEQASFEQHVLDALLFQSCKKNWQILLPLLKEKGASFSVRNDQGQTPLMIVAEEGQIDILKFLLEHDSSNINAQDLLDETALIKAANQGHYYCVYHLLSCRALMPIKNSHQETAFLCAVKKDHESVVDLLLKAATPVNAMDAHGNNALFYAIEHNNLSLLKKILKAGVHLLGKRKLFDETLLMFAIKKGCYPIIETLLDYNIHNNLDVLYQDAEGDSALVLAVRQGNENLVNLIASHILNVLETIMRNRMSQSLTPQQRWSYLEDGFLESRRLQLKSISKLLMAKVQNSWQALYYGYPFLSLQSASFKMPLFVQNRTHVKSSAFFHNEVAPTEPSIMDKPFITTSQRKPVVFSPNPCSSRSEESIHREHNSLSDCRIGDSQKSVFS